ncbi:MAG: type II CAAX prenyl endopeptidase Rce1 family protein [Thermoplasmata archaeon]
MSGPVDSPEAEVVPVACPRCGTSYTGNFCPSCGWQTGVPLPGQTSALRPALGVLWLIAMILFLVYLAASLGALVWISPVIVDGISAGACADCTGFFFWINPLSPNLLEFIEVGGPALLTWFFIVFGVIFVIFLHQLLFHGRRTYRDMRLPPERVDRKLASRSPVVAVGQVFMAILFFDTIFILIILPLLGVAPTLPPFFTDAPEWYVLYTAVNATVWEEVATRVLLIGLPMALASLVTRLSDVVSGQRVKGQSRGRHLAGSFKYLLGGHVHAGSPRPAVLVGAALVFVSAIIFGYLHVPGAGAWRFVVAFASGLAMGYLFLRHGIVASILFHFSINSLGVLVGVAEPSLGATVVVGLLYWALVLFGAGFLAYYTKQLGGLLLRPLFRSRRQPAPVPQSNPGRTDPESELLLFPVTCPQCGGREAEYQDGALLCSRCGTRLSTPGPDRGGSEVLD